MNPTILCIHAKIVYNSTIYSAAPGGWIWNAVTWTDASGSKPVTWTDASGSEVGVVTVAAAADFQGTQNWCINDT